MLGWFVGTAGSIGSQAVDGLYYRWYAPASLARPAVYTSMIGFGLAWCPRGGIRVGLGLLVAAFLLPVTVIFLAILVS